MDITGKKYGKLTVVRLSYRDDVGRLRWCCRCSCGKQCVVAGTSLRLGTTKSCGCARKDARRTHGLSKSSEYASWMAMMHRCENPGRTSYADYGGRGISVCKRWQKFENFYADMAPRPKGLSLERRDNRRGYCPSNCAWATGTEQANNRRNSVQLTYKGVTMTLSQWARHVGSTQSTLSWRYHQRWRTAEIINGRN